MRIKKRRLVGCLVVAVAAVFAACITGEPNTSTTELALYFTPGGGSSGSSNCGSAALGASTSCETVTISPNVGDSYQLVEIDATGCSSNIWTPVLPDVKLPYPIACTSAGSDTTMFSGTPVPTCIPSSYSFSATFSPTGPGAASCTMWARLLNGSFGTMESRAIYFNGSGVAPPVGLSVTPASYDFGQIPVGTTSSPITITLTNTGAGSASIGVTQSNSTLFPMGPGPTSLGPGSDAEFSVSCSPTTASTGSGSITFTGSGSGGSASRTVNLSCTGINSSITIDPNPAAFDSTLVGVAPGNVVVTIGTTGSPDILSSVQLANGASSDLTIVSGAVAGGNIGIGSGSSHQVTLRYAPTAGHPSGPLGNLLVSTAMGTPRTVAITGEALAGKLAAAPGAIDFGPVCVGSTATEMFEVYAEAPGTFNLIDVVDPSAPFGVTSQEFDPGIQLRGNHANAVTFTASVMPTAANPELTATVMLKTNLPMNADLPLELRAVALPEGVTPTPSAVDFGPNPVKSTTFAQKILLTNCGAAPINISAVRVTGANASEFAVVSPSNPLVMVPQKGEIEILVVMNPDTPGAKVAQLEIDHEGGTTIATLDGAAFGGADGGDGDLGTYYSCSVGAGTGLLPLGLALLLLRRRRRR